MALAMWTLSGFVDEISQDFATQCEVAQSLGLKYVELRSAWGVNILDLDDGQLAQVQDLLGLHDLLVSSVGSPIGKISIEEDFTPHLQRARHAGQVAQRLGAPYLRVFSFFIPAGGDRGQHRAEVLRRMAALTEVAGSSGVILVHENEKGIYGDTPERCLDIVQSVGDPRLRLAWDPANFVQVGVKPFTDGYALLRPYLEYMQVKDAHRDDGSVTVAGAGDGQVLRTVRALREDGYDGFFSLEPHLGDVHALGGFSGPELFTRAHAAFTDLLRAEGIPYA